MENGKLKLATTEGGSGDRLLVFVHGLGCARESFDGAFKIPELKDRFRMVSVDLPGFGESPKPRDFSYRLEDHAKLVVELVRERDGKDITIVGHSQGGVIGLLAARELGAAHINCEGNFVSADSSWVSRRNADMSEAEFLDHGFEDFVKSLESSDEPAYHEWARWCRQSDPLCFHRSARSLVKWSDAGTLVGMYKALPRRAYIYGDHGEITPALKQFAKDEVYAIPGSGHFMMLDNPEAFYQALIKAAA